MNAFSHEVASRFSVDLAEHCLGVRLPPRSRERLARASAATDDAHDVEFVQVRAGRDDPHRREWDAWDDRSHTQADRRPLTAFNHYLDIRKGPGCFDDYDGYSYHRGSAARGEYQEASEVTTGWAQALSGFTGLNVDAGLAFWFRNAYVHAPGHPWYAHCSPALYRYSFPADLAKYPSRRAELRARFPLVSGRTRWGQGFPYSVFMPVDNLARYWFERFCRRRSTVWEDLGPVLHGLQDASIPHHAAGCCGNWHQKYEFELDGSIQGWLGQAGFRQEAGRRLKRWMDNQAPAPAPMRPTHAGVLPGSDWRIQEMVTWLALRAYRAYLRVHGSFAGGYAHRPGSMRHLLLLATAAGAWALGRAAKAR